MSDSVDEVDHSMIDVGNDTTYLDGTQFEDVKRTLLDEFSTPVKPASSSGKTNNEAPEEHMKVYLRIRPFTQKEITKGENQGCMGVDNVNCLVTKAPKDSHTYKNSKHGGKTNHHFTFSKIFDASTTQKMFFDETVLNTVKDFIDGTNCLIFTYGVTNSGKTYTIQGLPSDGGILPRSLDVIFNSISDQQWHNMSLKPKMFADVTRLTPLQEELEHKIKEGVLKMAIPADEPDISSLMGDSDSSRLSLASTLSQDSLMMPPPVKRGRLTGSIGDKQEPVTEKETDDKAQLENVLAEAEQRVREEASVSVEMQGRIRFSVWVSYIEIYNEYIYDLLEPLPKKKNAKRPCLQLREDGNGVPYAKGVKEINVTSADEAYKIMTIGKQNLQMACTKLNHNSSRSHCIFTVKMLRVVDKDDPHMARISMLSFCDLAGSERYGKTGSMGDRIKEAGNINTSLLTLGRCIKVLRHNQLQRKRPIEFRDHPQIVPFRESKLTRQFQSFFCGKGKAAMIVNVNQNASTFDETLHALKYSAIAKQVVVVQEAPKEPPPRKKLKAASQGPRSHRLISMALAPSPGNSRSRATIGWATPGTMAKDMVEMEEQAMNLPLPVENTDELLEIDEEDEENCVENIDPEREQQLIDIIMKLKDALAAERRRIKTLDGDIRSEIASEMAQQLVRIETEYEEKLREEREIAEEMADKRIELYMQSVKKCKKRKRLVEEEEEEYIPSIQFHQEKIKVGELEDKVADLQKDLDEAKAHLKVVIEERDDLQKENTKVTFDIAELKSHLEKKQTSNVGTPSRDDLCHKEVVLKMQAQLQQLREDLQTKEKEVEELTETLAEAGETFQQKEGVISQLEKEMSELEKLHTESQEALTDASQRLLSKLEYIQELEGKVHQDQENKGSLLPPMASPMLACSLNHTPGGTSLVRRNSSFRQALSVHMLSSPPNTNSPLYEESKPSDDHRQSSGFYEHFTDISTSYCKTESRAGSRAGRSSHPNQAVQQDAPQTPDNSINESFARKQNILSPEDFAETNNKEGCVIYSPRVSGLPMSYSRFEPAISSTILCAPGIAETPPKKDYGTKKTNRFVAAARKVGLLKSSSVGVVGSNSQVSKPVKQTRSSRLRMQQSGSPQTSRKVTAKDTTLLRNKALTAVEEKNESKLLAGKLSPYRFFAKGNGANEKEADGSRKQKKGKGVLGKRRSSYQMRNKKKDTGVWK